MKRTLGIYLYGIIAGFCIGLGGTVFLRIKDTFPGSNVVGAFLFAIALFTICTRGYLLYTGKVCYVFDNKLGYILDVVIIWIGNLTGTVVMTLIEKNTIICGGENGIDVVARAMVEGKMASGFLSLFLLGILCNIFIFIGVNGYANNPHEVGKYLAIFLGVAIFILCGTEHSIADMYYWSISGLLFEKPGPSFLCLFVITLGNAVGGVLFPLIEKAYKKLTA